MRKRLARILVNGWPDELEFNQVIGRIISAAVENSANRFAFCFGEMVALLCADNKPKAAVRLEQLWNSLAEAYRFSLVCAYPLKCFSTGLGFDALFQICAEHTLAIPAEGPI